MRTLFVHPSPLMYSEIFLRLEPLGVERVAQAARKAGHDVRVMDLQVFGHDDLWRELQAFRPEAVGFGVNYLANIPEVLDLAKEIKRRMPGCFVFVGGHSVSFIAKHVLEDADGAVDAVVRGEGEVITPMLLEACRDGDVHTLPGVVTAEGSGPAPLMMDSLDDIPPARDLMRRRRKYFIGVLDPCASIEFTRGCPWDCSFCSAWTFYGRSYRKASPEAAAEEMASIPEPHVFVVDDVAFIRPEHGDGIAAELEKRKIEKQYYLETRADVLLRNTEVFERWSRLGLNYMFLGMEAIDAEGLEQFRKRVSVDDNMRALEVARRLGVTVAINLIVDPQWDEEQFRVMREFALAVPEIVHLTVMTPYPGTEIWHTAVPGADHPGLPALRHPARGDAHEAAAGEVLRGAGEDPVGDQPQAPRGRGAGQDQQDRGAPADARADELRLDALAFQPGLQPAAPAGRPPPAGALPAAGARASGPRAARPHPALHPPAQQAAQGAGRRLSLRRSAASPASARPRGRRARRCAAPGAAPDRGPPGRRGGPARPPPRRARR